jgi:hypothetical protein
VIVRAQLGDVFAVAGIGLLNFVSQCANFGDERLIAEIEMGNRTSR